MMIIGITHVDAKKPDTFLCLISGDKSLVAS